MTEDNWYTFSCPFCRQSLEATPDMGGTEIACPACNKKIPVPRDPSGENGPTIDVEAEVEPPSRPWQPKKKMIVLKPRRMQAPAPYHTAGGITIPHHGNQPIIVINNQGQIQQSEDESGCLIGAGYIFAIFMPIIGIILGIALIARAKSSAQGILVLVLSIAMIILTLAFWEGLAAALQ